ncbi:hypothetical protein NP233_g4403 [Leucocoprinus birnbaumii]|uniref:Uncharacterized protein n=1 Tax=Leucocoprinus birnbaumii TaxID=56174 RepID=A0AAD5YXM1_9AGAR|nr:hypothetical protein NP233_g4403 [Leucocoprinus birnbaumii]
MIPTVDAIEESSLRKLLRNVVRRENLRVCTTRAPFNIRSVQNEGDVPHEDWDDTDTEFDPDYEEVSSESDEESGYEQDREDAMADNGSGDELYDPLFSLSDLSTASDTDELTGFTHRSQLPQLLRKPLLDDAPSSTSASDEEDGPAAPSYYQPPPLTNCAANAEQVDFERAEAQAQKGGYLTKNKPPKPRSKPHSKTGSKPRSRTGQKPPSTASCDAPRSKVTTVSCEPSASIPPAAGISDATNNPPKPLSTRTRQKPPSTASCRPHRPRRPKAASRESPPPPPPTPQVPPPTASQMPPSTTPPAASHSAEQAREFHDLDYYLNVKKYKLVKWDGIQPVPFLDSHKHVFVCLAGRPTGEGYLRACSDLYDLSTVEFEKAARKRRKPKVWDHKRGFYPTVDVGLTYAQGGPQSPTDI